MWSTGAGHRRCGTITLCLPQTLSSYSGLMLDPLTLAGDWARLEPLSLDHVSGLAAAAAEDRSSFSYTWVPDGLADAERYVLGRVGTPEDGAGAGLGGASHGRRRNRGKYPVLGPRGVYLAPTLAARGEPWP